MPLISVARVGQQRAVLWKSVNRSPPAASASRFGVSISPPKQPRSENPMSSVSTIRMFGRSLSDDPAADTATGHATISIEKQMAVFVILQPRKRGGSPFLRKVGEIGEGDPKGTRSQTPCVAIIGDIAVVASCQHVFGRRRESHRPRQKSSAQIVDKLVDTLDV